MGIEPKNYSDFKIADIVGDPTINKIISFSELPEGWDFGEGNSITENVIINAIKLTELGKSYQFEVNALPDSNGNVILNFFMNEDDNFIVVTIGENGEFSLQHEEGIGEDYDIKKEIENATFGEVSNYLKWFSYEYYISKNTIRIEEDLEAIASKIYKGEFQFTSKIAGEKKVPQTVTIFPNTTEQLQAIL